MGRLKKLKKIRIHREGTHILWASFLLLLLINAALYWGIDCKIPFYVVAVASIAVYLLMVNFFRCPIRLFGKDTEKIVVAPADGKIVVIEEVDENEYFHDRRLMISIFMSIVNVHANWYPVDGTIKKVAHHNGNFMKAWLPKASTENERSTVVIETPEGVEVLTRQIAGRGTTHCHLRRSRRRMLYRRTHGLYQIRFPCGCISAPRHRSLCQHGTINDR